MRNNRPNRPIGVWNTGTLIHEILAKVGVADEASLSRALAKHGLRASWPLGVSKSNALGMATQRAKQFRIAKISDLRRFPALRFGLSGEFLNREDGWPALRAAYGNGSANARGLDHDIAYKGLADGSIDVIDLCTTAAEIAYYGIRILDDDRRQFPYNQAVVVYHADMERYAPKAMGAMLQLEGRIDTPAMIAMNRAVKIDRRPEAEVAAQFVANNYGIVARESLKGFANRLLDRTIEHLRLTVLSLAAAILLALPLGVVTAKRPALGQAILAAASIMHTIPSLALLVFMIPILGIGATPP